MKNQRTLLLTLLALAGLGGCALTTQPLVVAVAGAGTTSVVGHSMDGAAFRTFTAPLDEVKAASLDTLSLMGIRVDSFESGEHGELITGSAIRRTIEIRLEPISSRATRMHVVTKDEGVFRDSATATEVVLQTEKALGVNEPASSSYGASRPR